MKLKRFLILCVALCLLLFSACGEETGDPNVYDVEYNGKNYTVDYNQMTVTVDGYTCQFQVTGNGSGTKFNVIYPNGSSYFWNQSENFGSGGWSDDYDETRYVSGETLWNVLELDRTGAQKNSGYWFVGLLLVGFGILEAAYPQVSWYLSHGWKYKNAEPSDLALGLGRVGGIIMIIAGVICFFV